MFSVKELPNDKYQEIENWPEIISETQTGICEQNWCSTVGI